MDTQFSGNDELPLEAEKIQQLERTFSGLEPFQLQWVSGYAAGLAVSSSHLAAAEQSSAPVLKILYGSQTGNGEAVVKWLESQARDQGCQVVSSNLADYKSAGLKQERLLAFVVSTHGEGDPPDDAELFHEFLLSVKAPQLTELQYSVLALGDSSYINFCKTGREIDSRLAELGGERLLPMVECDYDYKEKSRLWGDSVIAKLPDQSESTSKVSHLRAIVPSQEYDRQRPYTAEILVNQKITGVESSKDVRHIELSLQDAGLRYEPGDSLAVVTENPPRLVRQILSELAIAKEALVSVKEERMPIVDALAAKLEITALSPDVVQAWCGHSDSAALRELLGDDPEAHALLAEYLTTHQLIDMLRLNPAIVDAQVFVDGLRSLHPRLYSIASSHAANPDEVHLAVAAVRYKAYGSDHWGAASTHLTDRLGEGDRVSVYVEPNTRFRLPSDNDVGIIMICAGTGVAPFRAFVEDRVERRASGKNWLFFGDRNFSSDFLYQLEWQRCLKRGQLDRLDLAFSRDQPNKIYVQDRIRQQGEELYSWITGGAHIYVCGDASQMAAAVDEALVEVLSKYGGETNMQSLERLKEMRRTRRFQRDVY
ncbi:MAG: assimilatory sulfite reductase (NADPH) flavoprotein subunit [Granulosicoccus sp.]